MEKEHQLTVTRTAHYYTLGELNEKTRFVWWVLHGYGQLAKYFIRHFEPIMNEDTFIIAPEGLSRFYLSNNWERVGASWMTKENRLTEINDQLRFLNQLKELTYGDYSNFETVALGFSQGTATAWRWLTQSELRPEHLVLWAGMIPAEIQSPLPFPLKVHAVYGTEDPYFSEEKRNSIQHLIEESGSDYNFYTFSGGHTINAELLYDLNLKIRA